MNHGVVLVSHPATFGALQRQVQGSGIHLGREVLLRIVNSAGSTAVCPESCGVSMGMGTSMGVPVPPGATASGLLAHVADMGRPRMVL